MPRPFDLRVRNRCLQGSAGALHQRRDIFLCPLRSVFPSPFLVLPLLLTIFLVSCGGATSSSAPPPPPIIVTVLPASAHPFTGTNVAFTASVQNAGSTTVTWQVNGEPGGDITTVGAITPSGEYTAPNSVPNPPTVRVTAVLQSDSNKTGSSNVTIQPQSSIQGPLSLSPALSSVTTSQTLQLQVTTDGLSNSQVNWAVDGFSNGNLARGTITPTGLYTPPSTAGPHLITATLQANTSAIGSATVEVTDFAGTITWRNDNSRIGQNTKELALAPGSVSSSTFGKIFSCQLDGQAYAQPLYVANVAVPGKGTRNVVFVATEKDTVYAFDADANTNPCLPLWQKSLIPVGEIAVQTPIVGTTSKDIAPFIGITGTPVIDLNSSTLYVVAETQTAAINPSYLERLYALELATGQLKIVTAGVQVLTAFSINPAFSPQWANQRAALLLDNGTVYIAFASHHGEGIYHGWLIGYDAATLQQNMIFDVTPAGVQGGIWQSGGGPSADSNHNVFVATGFGTFDAYRGGQDYGDSFLLLGTGATPSVADYFSPCDEAALAARGQDPGSSAPVLLPDSAGSVPHLMVGAAKNGSLYVLNRDNLGKHNNTCPDLAPGVQVVLTGDASILSTPLFWNDFIYVAAENGKLKAFPMASGILQPAPSSQSAATLGPQGATPVVSSNGANNAIIWLIDTSGALAAPNSPAILRAFDASNLSDEIYNSAMVPGRDAAGLAVKFTVPTVANGKVYVGTQTELDVYGLLH
jgi:hypothetical protein